MSSDFPRFAAAAPLGATPRADLAAAAALDPERLAPLVGSPVVVQVFPGGSIDGPATIAAGTLIGLSRTAEAGGQIVLDGGIALAFARYDAITIHAA